jgi:hypothetical protein
VLLEKFVATALIVGVVGPLFWLGVKVLENWLTSLVNKARSRWRRQKAASHDGLRK